MIIPAANLQHLMLREDIVAAIDAGHFHIYAVTNIDEAMELLTDTAAGVRDEAGHFTPDSLNERVVSRLRELGDTLREFGGGRERAEGSHAYLRN